MKPLDAYCLAAVVKEHDHRVTNRDGQGATTTEVLLTVRWENARHHEHGTISKRLSDLRDAGLIEATDDHRVSPLTKQRQRVWVPTEAGRQAVAFLAGERWSARATARAAAHAAMLAVTETA